MLCRGPAYPRANRKMDGIKLEKVDSYVYLDHEVNMRHNLQPKITRRRDFQVAQILKHYCCPKYQNGRAMFEAVTYYVKRTHKRKREYVGGNGENDGVKNAWFLSVLIDSKTVSMSTERK